jgi:hypothetical protein
MSNLRNGKSGSGEDSGIEALITDQRKAEIVII